MTRILVIAIPILLAGTIACLSGDAQQPDQSHPIVVSNQKTASLPLRRLPQWPHHPSEMFRHRLSIELPNGDFRRDKHYRGEVRRTGSYFMGTTQAIEIPVGKTLIITDIIFKTRGMFDLQLCQHRASSNKPLEERKKLQVPDPEHSDVLLTIRDSVWEVGSRRKQPTPKQTLTIESICPPDGHIKFETGIVVESGAVLDLLLKPISSNQTSYWQQQTHHSQSKAEVIVHGYYYREEPIFGASDVLNAIKTIESDLTDGHLKESVREQVLKPISESAFGKENAALTTKNRALQQEVERLKSMLKDQSDSDTQNTNSK